MLLLFAPIGPGKPLNPREYRSLARMLAALGEGGADPAEDLTAEELRRLGQTQTGADEILRLLSREDALDRWCAYLDRRGIFPLTRVSPEYPVRLRKVLGDRAPMLLLCAGDLRLLQTECVALVGSRKLRAPGLRFARTAGEAAADQGLTLVSGGAVGADTAAFDACLEYGGSAVVFLADSLEQRMERLKRERSAGSVLLVSEDGTDLPFSIPRAYSRNRLIHAMGSAALVAQSDCGAGGTWQGAVENLKNNWSPVFVSNLEPEDPGYLGLVARGANPAGLEDLTDLGNLGREQTRLF